MKSPFTAAVAACTLGVGVWLYIQPPTASPHAHTSPSANAESSTSRLAITAVVAEVASRPPGTAVRASVAAPTDEPSTEESFATAMHALEKSNPTRALEMAREGQKRWPHSKRAAEFARTEVKCLYALGKPSEGRGAAEAMVNKYVGSPWALEVERETGAHPYVNH